LIHVDGPPGAGVGRLAQRLADDLHFGVDQRKPQPLDLAQLLRRELTCGPHVVVAHGPVSLHAYAYAVNSHKYRAPLGTWELHLLDRAALASGAVLIYAAARLEEVAQLADPKEARDEFTQRLGRAADRLLEGFEQALATTRLPLVRVDGPRLQEDGYQKLVAWVRAELLRQRQDVFHHAEHRSSGNCQRPTLALVGDRYPELGHDLRDQPGARAFLRAAGSSWTLHRALTAAGVDDAYLCNWHRSGDEVADLFHLRRELERVDPQHVVALGQAAGRALRKLKIPHPELPHPAHQRRFNAGAFGAYVKRLTRACEDVPEWPPVHLLTDV
jgi:hypothetical protein